MEAFNGKHAYIRLWDLLMRRSISACPLHLKALWEFCCWMEWTCQGMKHSWGNGSIS